MPTRPQLNKDLIAVIGPNGSGKSSVIYTSNIDRAFTFINPDDVASRSYANIEDQEKRDLLAWSKCNELRDELLDAGISFGIETVGSHPSKVEFLHRAKELGYVISLLFVATEDPGINIRRIADRVLKGGHTVPDEKVRLRYYRTLELLPRYCRKTGMAHHRRSGYG
ncbi:MAG: zeta toxin family protein [Coriobacteriaceae bacterium]|jgi:predicted ABC-type ATPase|nr:zeta toxin family protein [Coriobacteriaceae bacterium]